MADPAPEAEPEATATSALALPTIEPNETVTVRVAAADGTTIYFKIKAHTAMRKLMHTYCNKVSADPSRVRFIYNGDRVSENATPHSLELEDDDVIDVLVEQVGGAR